MAAAKSTKKTSTKSKTKSKTTTKKTGVKKSTAKKTTAKKTTAKKKTTTKRSSKTSSKTTKGKTVDFIGQIVKVAVKSQKTAQTQTKSLNKELNTLDKQYAQLCKKQVTAKGKTWQNLETKVTKLKTQITATRTALINSQNTVDRIASIVDMAKSLNSKPVTVTATYTSSSSVTKRPTLVTPKQQSTPRGSMGGTYSTPDTEEDEDLGFDFGDDDDMQDDIRR